MHLTRPPFRLKKHVDEAGKMGRNFVLNGPTADNLHPLYFTNKHLRRAWIEGKQSAEADMWRGKLKMN